MKSGKALWDEIQSNYYSGNDEWVETTEEMFDEMLGAVPPVAMISTAFLMGEPWNHNDAGQAVYAAFKAKSGKCFAKYMTVNEFRSDFM